jgi:hypothetical protein
MNTETAIEYRSVPLSFLTESKTNPRRIFENAALKELAGFVSGHKMCPFRQTCDSEKRRGYLPIPL